MASSPFCSGDGVDGAGQDNGWPTHCISLPRALSTHQPAHPTGDAPTTYHQSSEISSSRIFCTKGRSFLPKPLREELPGGDNFYRGVGMNCFSNRILQQGEWDLQAQASSNRQSSGKPEDALRKSRSPTQHRSKSHPEEAPQIRCFPSAHPEEADESVKLLLQRGSLGGQGQPVVPAGWEQPSLGWHHGGASLPPPQRLKGCQG